MPDSVPRITTIWSGGGHSPRQPRISPSISPPRKRKTPLAPSPAIASVPLSAKARRLGVVVAPQRAEPARERADVLGQGRGVVRAPVLVAVRLQHLLQVGEVVEGVAHGGGAGRQRRLLRRLPLAAHVVGRHSATSSVRMRRRFSAASARSIAELRSSITSERFRLSLLISSRSISICSSRHATAVSVT